MTTEHDLENPRRALAAYLTGRASGLPEPDDVTALADAYAFRQAAAWWYRRPWRGDYGEPCVTCGRPGLEHCLDDECCPWDPDVGVWGGALLSGRGDCCAYRPRVLRNVATSTTSGDVSSRQPPLCPDDL